MVPLRVFKGTDTNKIPEGVLEQGASKDQDTHFLRDPSMWANSCSRGVLYLSFSFSHSSLCVFSCPEQKPHWSCLS